MSTVTAIQGVDEILYALSTAAVSSLAPKPDITVGPLDGDEATADAVAMHEVVLRGIERRATAVQ